jgi:methionyl-tRNA formyltransferase
VSLRLVVIGQAAFGEQTLERLAAKHEVVAAYVPPDPPSGKLDPLKAKAVALGIPVHQPRSMKSDEVFAAFAEHRADLAVLAYVTVIVPERVIALPRLGSICFHPSLLPRYRGGSAINWQLIRGEREGGLTVFWTDAGIDTGPILLQKPVEIGPDDTAGSFYYEKIFPVGVEAMEEAVDLVDAGKAPRIVQDEAQATYDPLCRTEHVGIDWSRPAREVYDLVRGADPQPGAWARRDGTVVRFYDARLDPETRGEPGRVHAIDERGVLVTLADGAIRAARVRIGDSPAKAKPAEAAASGVLAVGDRLAAGT